MKTKSIRNNPWSEGAKTLTAMVAPMKNLASRYFLCSKKVATKIPKSIILRSSDMEAMLESMKQQSNNMMMQMMQQQAAQAQASEQ